MRSELVFRANDKVANRFELCHLASSSARSMVRSSVGMHLTINQAFEAIGGQSVRVFPAEVPIVEEVGASLPALDILV
ncbi:MAG TPA: hypothetical protein VJ453_01550 [Terriglobales bacterium]|jgi:hypothetical protein|nr:hypothetical protein [Terriglobales bacterium]